MGPDTSSQQQEVVQQEVEYSQTEEGVQEVGHIPLLHRLRTEVDCMTRCTTAVALRKVGSWLLAVDTL